MFCPNQVRPHLNNLNIHFQLTPCIRTPENLAGQNISTIYVHRSIFCLEIIIFQTLGHFLYFLKEAIFPCKPLTIPSPLPPFTQVM